MQETHLKFQRNLSDRCTKLRPSPGRNFPCVTLDSTEAQNTLLRVTEPTSTFSHPFRVAEAQQISEPGSAQLREQDIVVTSVYTYLISPQQQKQDVYYALQRRIIHPYQNQLFPRTQARWKFRTNPLTFSTWSSLAYSKGFHLLSYAHGKNVIIKDQQKSRRTRVLPSVWESGVNYSQDSETWLKLLDESKWK